MIDRVTLQRMYQQWQQGIDECALFHMRFVEMVSNQYKINQEALLEELKKCPWFHYPK